MRWVTTLLEMIPGIALIVTGEIWLLQGLGKLPGSFMTGSAPWVIVGAITMLIGIAFLVRVGARS